MQPFDTIQWEILQQYCSNILGVPNKPELTVIFKSNSLNTFATPKAQKLGDVHLLANLLKRSLQTITTIHYG